MSFSRLLKRQFARFNLYVKQQIRKIAADTQGKVAVACALPGSKLNCDLDAHAHPPMQSVFRLPLAIAVLHLVEQGEVSLHQEVLFHAWDRILPHVYSPRQAKYPEVKWM